MAEYEAYGQTDVMNDPRYLATLRGRQGRDARAAYEVRQRQQQQRQEFDERMAAQALARREGEANREVSRQQIEEYRQSRLGNAQQAQEAAKMEHMRTFITNPPAGTNPAELQNAREQYYRYMGIPMGLTKEQTAENEVRKAHGQPLIQPPQTGGQPGVAAGGAAAAGGVPTEANTGEPLEVGKPVAAPRGIGSSLERGVQAAVGGEPTSAPYYNAQVGANMVRTASGREIPVGAPDPSVGATETATRTPLVGGGEQLNFPSGGIAKSGVAGETRAAKALREPMFAPSQLGGGKDTGPTTPGEQAGLPVGYKVISPQPGQGTLFNPVTGKMGAEANAPATAPAPGGPGDTSGRHTAGASPIPPTDVAPPGTPASAPSGSAYGINAHPSIGGFRFGPNAAYSPSDLDKPNAWTVPPSMRGPSAGVPEHAPTQPQFAPSNLAQPPGTGPFGHPVPPMGSGQFPHVAQNDRNDINNMLNQQPETQFLRPNTTPPPVASPTPPTTAKPQSAYYT